MRGHHYAVPDEPMFPMETTGTTESGLDILRGIGSLLVKHRPSISEGEKNCCLENGIIFSF